MSRRRRVFGLALLWSSASFADVEVDQPAPPPPSEPGTAAPDAAPPAIEEVVVTARRTAELLQDVPIAVSVLNAEALAAKNITTTNDLATSVPGLSGMSLTDRTRTVYSMRGQGEAFFGNAPGVVAYFAEAADFSSFLYDLASVQVLKGPQGTLFGRNTTGGAVLFTPQRPTPEWSGYALGRLGDYSRRDLEFAVGGPVVSEWVSVRIAGQVLRRDGYTHNLFSGRDLDDEHRESFRLSIVLTPIEGVENDIIVQTESSHENGTSEVLHAFVDSPTTPHQNELRAFLAEQEARGPRKVSNDAPLYYRGKSHGVIDTATWDVLDGLTIKNIFSWRKSGFSNYADEDGSPYRIANAGYDHDIAPTRTTTEEVQVRYAQERWDALAGFYYEHAVKEPSTLFVNLSAPVTSTPLDFHIFAGNTNTSQAFFAQGSVTLFDDLSLTAGVRRTVDDRKAVAQQDLVVAVVPVTTLPRTHLANTFHATTWSTSATYRIARDLMAYATIRRGYKTGGFNDAASTPERQSYQPEFVLDHEIGVKSEWRGGGWQMRANADIFYDDYRDIQRNLVQPSIVPSTIISNAAAGQVKGFDLDLLVVPSPLVDVALQYTYLDCTYDRYDDPQLGDLSNGRFPNTPDHQLTFTPSLHVALARDAGMLLVQGTVYWQSKVAFDPTNEPNGNATEERAVPGSLRPDYARVDLRLEWSRMFGAPLSVAAFVRNLTDEDYVVGSTNALGTSLVGTGSWIYGPPRFYGVEIRYPFQL